MANTVRPKNREEADKKLASDPATRRLMADEQGRQAAREWRSDELSSVTPIPQKKSGLQKVKDFAADAWQKGTDAFHSVVDEDTPEVKEMRKKYGEELYEAQQRQVDKKAKDLLTTIITLGPTAVTGGTGLGSSIIKGAGKLIGAGISGVTAGTVADALMDGGEKKTAKAETVPSTNVDNTSVGTNVNNNTTGSGTSTTNNTKTNTDKAEEEDKTYDNYIAKVAKQQGLGKYVKEDGTVDYDKLQKSKVGYQILNALLGGIAGAAAGAAFKDAPDMSKSMLAQEVAKRNRVADEAQKTAEQEKQNALDLSTFTAKLGLQGQQALNAQKEMARFMSNLSYNDQVRMMKYMQGMSVQDAMKLGFAQNPYGAMGAAFQSLGGIANAFSDESCKKFASRNVFK